MATSAPWLASTLDLLTDRPAIGYLPGGSVATEPTALASLALLVHERFAAAKSAANALVSYQQKSGAVGIRAGEPAPGWPSSHAMIAWQRTDPVRYRTEIASAAAWLLANRGLAIERSVEFGHDTTLVGWAYAEQTHSWVEPTSFAVLALKAIGQGESPACREGIALLLDRQLPGGGLNYGNTYVLGQLIRPHVQPTAIALLGLAGDQHCQSRIAKSVAWLHRSISPQTTPLSLGWAILALKAHGLELAPCEEWLAAAAGQVQSRDRSLYKLALLALAAKGWPL
jgi:hypothetical protein